MIVTLDGERLKGAFPDETLQALVEEVRRARLGDRLVVSVTLDGQLLLDQELTERLNEPVGDVNHVELISADPHELVSSALREVAEQLESAAENEAVVANQLQSGEMPEAAAAFSEFLQVWQACQRTIVGCSGLLGKDLTTMHSGGKPIRAHLDSLTDKLRELRDAFEARDTVLLSDLFQYEMPQTCRTWQDILNELATNLAGQTGAPAS